MAADPAAQEAPARPLPRLERLLQPRDPVALDSAPGTGSAEWLTVGEWRLLARPRFDGRPSGDVLEEFVLAPTTRVAAVRNEANGSTYVPFDPDEAYRNYVTEAWRGRTRVRALSERQLAFYYRFKRVMPPRVRLGARRVFIRMNGLPEFPAWPLERGVERLLRFVAGCLLAARDADEAPFAWFWPMDYRAALILTHDVESAAGLRLAVEVADLEEERGLRSSFNVVAGDYEVDLGIVRELTERGFEIGLHGLHHNHSLFSSRRDFERQLAGLASAARSLGAEGFRSPATHRVSEWLHELPVSYDCSVPHSDPYEPSPGGCCSLWPFMLGDVVELPYTLPQDHTLFTLLRHRTVEPWLAQLRAVEERFGLIQCLSHPDPGYLGDPGKRAIYVEFLDAVAEREGLWKALPRTVAAWWRRREAGQPAPDQRDGTMRRRPAPDYAAFEPPRELL